MSAADKVKHTVSMRRRGLGPDTGDSVLAGPIYTAPPEPKHCGTCNRNPSRMNSEFAECSHVECPFRGKAWSDRPTAAKLFKGPYRKNVDEDPRPLDAKKGGAR